MGMPTPDTQLAEWRHFWFLPVAAGLGYATAVLYIYVMGPFIDPIGEEFGWSRAQISSGITIAAFFSAIFCIPVGMLVDRIGPRPVGLLGVLMMCGSLALLGTATGSGANWVVLWGVLAVSTLFVQATVWTSAVNSRFEKSRGLALAVTLSGASLSAVIGPVMATWLIEKHDWRVAFVVLAAGWFVVVFPMLLLGFRSARDAGSAKHVFASGAVKQLTGVSVAYAVRSRAMYALILAAGGFAFTAMGMVVHFVPILTDAGAEKLAAAGVASLVGIFSVVGRIGTGFLLDRLPGHLIGASACFLPIIASVLLMLDGANSMNQVIAAIIFGLTLGSEVDVIAYLAARYFGLKNFGAIYGAMVMALAVGTAFGPLGAGAMYDAYGSYNAFLIVVLVVMGVSAVALFSLGNTPTADEVVGDSRLGS